MDLAKVNAGHILAVEMNDGTEALAWVQWKKWTTRTRGWGYSVDWNPYTEDATPHIRVVWLKATGAYVRAWHNTYNGKATPYEASLPDFPDSFGERRYGNFRVLDREEVLSLEIELEIGVYGPDQHETIKRTMTSVYQQAQQAS